jgi:hypothetical protein
VAVNARKGPLLALDAVKGSFLALGERVGPLILGVAAVITVRLRLTP